MADLPIFQKGRQTVAQGGISGRSRSHTRISQWPARRLAASELQILYVSLSEEEAGLSTLAVAGRACCAFEHRGI